MRHDLMVMDGVDYIRVCEDEDETPIEIPIETDGTVLLTTLNGMFPKATGLKYLSASSGCFRGVRLSEGKLYSPPEGWVHVYYCAFPKDNKRKGDENQVSLSPKSKKLDEKKCTDLIVLNLAWRTDEASLRDYFSRYGDLITVQIKRHPGTQQSKGYGFIRFNDYVSQINCLAERHNIDGRWCDVRIPMSKLEGDRQEVSRKVHVGGISENMNADVLRNFFSQYGAVVDVFIPKPFRSFAFVTFEDPEVAAELLGKDQILNGVNLTIGSAVPKLPPHPGRYNMGMHTGSQYAAQNPWVWPYPASVNGSNMRNFNSGMYGAVGNMHGYNMMSHPSLTNSFQLQYSRNMQSNGNRINM